MTAVHVNIQISDQVSGFCSALLVSEDGKLANTICEQQQHLYSELYHNILCSVGLKGLYYCDNTRVSDWHCNELEDSRHLTLFGKGYMARPWRSQMISKCTQVCDQVSDCCVSEDGNMVQPWICRHSSGMIYSMWAEASSVLQLWIKAPCMHLKTLSLYESKHPGFGMSFGNTVKVWVSRCLG